MADEKNPIEETKPAEEKPKQTEQAEPKEEEKPSSEPPKSEEEKPTDEKQADENGEGADESATQAEEPQEPETAKEPALPEMTREQELEAENFKLKTQIEAMKIGFSPDVIEDAVVLAENIVKRDGSDITAALNAVAKKYPDWKADSKNGKSKGGFKVGADTSGSKSTSNEKLNKAFGIKK